MCVITCQFDENSFFYTTDGWFEHESTSLRSQQCKKFNLDFLVSKKGFCFFSKRSFVNPAVCPAETDEAWKNTFLGFVFYCLIFNDS